tara:strand:+ start:358 stop:753 length:396 start_codon:yes stop_codon:yes gene_type:complete
MKSVEALLSITLATIAADGVLHEEEAIALRGRLQTQSAFKDIDLPPLIEKILFQLKNIGIDAVAEDAMSSLSIEQQETAIAISTYIAHSDKVLCKKEDAFLNKLAISSKIPSDKARAIIDSIILLHRDIFT